jgi:hypothetical protein
MAVSFTEILTDGSALHVRIPGGISHLPVSRQRKFCRADCNHESAFAALVRNITKATQFIQHFAFAAGALRHGSRESSGGLS